ncbi:hypothetical protein DAY52_01120 [Salmonella enterica subsp. enterica serovar Enteritidis]|nr:hypothetical protein [Salmonella enterica subsp. enterica serovar Enteritidis]
MRKDVWLENLVDGELEGIELSLPERADTVLAFLVKQADREPVGIFSVDYKDPRGIHLRNICSGLESLPANPFLNYAKRKLQPGQHLWVTLAPDTRIIRDDYSAFVQATKVSLYNPNAERTDMPFTITLEDDGTQEGIESITELVNSYPVATIELENPSRLQLGDLLEWIELNTEFLISSRQYRFDV